MRVRMTKHITGYRDGEEWPAVGGDIDVPAHEAADLIANHYAEPAPEPQAAVPVDLVALKVGELRDLAAKRGVDLDGVTKKGDIIAALELAQEEADAPATADPGDGAAEAAGPDGSASGEEADAAGEPEDG